MYIVEYRGNGDYLTDGYWKGIKRHTSIFLSDAHIFTPFELKLALKTILHNKHNFKVYKVGGLDDFRNDL